MLFFPFVFIDDTCTLLRRRMKDIAKASSRVRLFIYVRMKIFIKKAVSIVE